MMLPSKQDDGGIRAPALCLRGSVVFSRSSSLVVTDSLTDTLLPLPLLLVPVLDESSVSSYELDYTASLDAQSNTNCTRSRNSAQRLLEIAMHVIVTDQHCQRQASSCIDIASLDSCTPIVKVRTCWIGVKHDS